MQANQALSEYNKLSRNPSFFLTDQQDTRQAPVQLPAEPAKRY